MFLSSKYANNISGSVYTVDGGWVAQWYHNSIPSIKYYISNNSF